MRYAQYIRRILLTSDIILSEEDAMNQSITKEYHINASVSSVWDALINPETIDAWGGGPAVMNNQVGFEFSLWGGSIHGTNTEVINNYKLAQNWFNGDWPKPSELLFKITESQGDTLLELKQTGVPENEIDDIDSGWDDYYLGAIKSYLESK